MKISENILKLFGWKLIGDFPEIKKSVVVMAPHTSNWDFAIGRLYLNAIGISNNTLMKKELFVFPLSIILKSLGAIPIDRANKSINVVDQAAEMFNNREKLNLFVAAEGTRKKAVRWKKGFYHISKKANVPIVVSFIDYEKKEIGIKGIVNNEVKEIDEVMKELRVHYKDVTPKYPQNFVLDKRY